MSPSTSSTSARPAPPAAESLAGRLAAMTHDLLGAASTADRRIVWTNPAWYPLLGWTEEELQTGSYHRFVHPDDLPRLKRAEAALLEGRGGERPEIELRLRGRDGGYRWVAFSASHSPADGLLFVSGKDVTARRQGEEELRNADQRYRAVTDATRDGIVSADINGRIIFWNAGAETIFGRDAADALGRPLADLMPERYRDAHRAGMARFLATGQGRLMGSTVEVEGLRADGSEFPLELTLGTWTQSGQRCFTGVLRDVSERVRSRQALREAEERFASAFDGAAVGLVLAAPDGTLLRANRALASSAGGPRRSSPGAAPPTAPSRRPRRRPSRRARAARRRARPPRGRAEAARRRRRGPVRADQCRAGPRRARGAAALRRPGRGRDGAARGRARQAPRGGVSGTLPGMAEVAMPRLSDSMEEGTILKWLKSDGDDVSRGEELVEIETDKANMTYEADLEGVLKIVAQEGDTLPVGQTIAQIGEGGGDSGGGESAQAETSEEPEAAQPAAEDEVERVKQPEPVATEEKQEEPEPEREGNGRVKASPIARRMAKDLGVELGSLQGSGPGGRIVKSDVEAAAKDGGEPEEEPQEKPREAPKPVVSGDGGRGATTTEDLSRLQQTIARRMAESKATAPDFVITCEVDMHDAVEFRKQLKAAAGEDPAPSFNDFVVKASALALKEFPRANGAYRDGKFELYSRVNVGIAVAGQDALIVPTVFDADTKSIGQISRDARALAERVRAGKITPPELSSGTFSVSNLGMFGIKRFTAVINPPQAAILAVGEMTPRPVVRDGEITVRPVMELTLSCDHRILYGADAAQFLGRIRERLENPLSLAL